MLKILGIYMIIPTALLLTVSFFVLYALQKMGTKGLKVFGYVIAALLWISALIAFSTGAYTIATGKHPMVQMMQQICPVMGERTPMGMMGRGVVGSQRARMPVPMRQGGMMEKPAETIKK